MTVSTRNQRYTRRHIRTATARTASTAVAAKGRPRPATMPRKTAGLSAAIISSVSNATASRAKAKVLDQVRALRARNLVPAIVSDQEGRTAERGGRQCDDAKRDGERIKARLPDRDHW